MDRHALFAVAEDLDWPAVEACGLAIEGEDSWRRALLGPPPAIPRECRQILASLAPHLLTATDGARERLGAWQARPPGAPESPEALWARLRDRVGFYGDDEMLPPVVEALFAVPAPVREVLLPDVAIIGVGWSTRGWCSPAMAPGPAFLIVVSGAAQNAPDVEHSVRHELGHLWLKAPRPILPAKTARGQAMVRAVAEAERWSVIPAVDARYAREERLAEAMAVLWGLDR